MSTQEKSGTPRESAHRKERRLIDRHFARRIAPRDERILRTHLPDCESCRRYYERQMAVGEMLPLLPGMADRLGAGLGIAAPARRAPPLRRWVLATGTLVAACAVLLLARRGTIEPRQEEFTARGAAEVDERPRIEVYRVAPGRRPGEPSSWMSASGELAFAYRNPTGFGRLMVFGMGDGGEVYWFHPAWNDASANPRAVPISPGTGPFELPEAIAHDVQGSRLRIMALFTNEALSVREVEDAVRSGRTNFPGATLVETVLEVRP